MFADSPDNPKLKKDDRILVLEAMEGGARSTDGRLDQRLFSGENSIHLMRQKNNIWTVRYDKGIVPPALNQQFTSFQEGYKTIAAYYKKRNVRISKVIE